MSLTHLILISGPPGSGKSTLARGMAQKLSTVLLDKDCIEGWESFKKTDRMGAKNPLPHQAINMEEAAEKCLLAAVDFIRP